MITSEKLASLGKYLPYAGLGALGLGGLYGGYRMLRPEPTLWDKAMEYLPSMNEVGASLSEMAAANPDILNALAQQGMSNQNMPPVMPFGGVPSEALMAMSPNSNLQKQLMDMNPYTPMPY